MENANDKREVKLKVCDLTKCEARCCYDGVYLTVEEESKINQLVYSEEDFFKYLPKKFIIDGNWGNGRISGRKTATKAYEYKSPDYPEHFTKTRCIFCREDHKCSLQVLAINHGLHKWAYKPNNCWLFPLSFENDELSPPPSIYDKDPQDIGPDYPGYVKFTPCGTDDNDGEIWTNTLKEEIVYWKSKYT